MDKSLCEFGTYLYDLNARRGCLQQFRSSLLGLILILPELKTHLGRSRQLKKGCDCIVPERCPRPLPLSTVNALCAWLASHSRYCESLAINLDFHGFLRANEILKLKLAKICFPGDVRLSDFPKTRAGCVFRHAKTESNQFVPLTDYVLLHRMQLLTNSLPSDSDTLFSLTYASLTPTFKEALRHFKLAEIDYNLHSLRDGGTIFEWLCRKPLKDVIFKGRWSSDKSL